MTDVQKIKIDLPENSRVETGVVQFNDDWPGIFIRGDNAIYFGYLLSNISKMLKDSKDPLTKIELLQLDSFKKFLQSCAVNSRLQEQ